MSEENQVQRTRVKVCGMTRVDDVQAAVALGVDAIGMILHAQSPRLINVQQAQQLRAKIPAFVSVVGVFVDCDAGTINDYSTQIGLDLIQLHGRESNDFGASLNTPFIKAIRAQNAEQVAHAVTQYPDARALLLDPYVKGQHGGTGKQLDLSLWPQKQATMHAQSLILAGGLSPDNVADAVNQVGPFAVDLNSGVESAPGIKDADLIAQAMQQLLIKS